MNQDQIDANAATLFADITGGAPTGRSKQLIDLNGPVSPAVLAGLFGVSVANIYQYRQNGRLPADTGASYRDCFLHHITFMKDKAGGKVASLREAGELQRLQLDRVKTEKAWLEVKAERKELIDREVLAGLFEPLFLQVRSQLNSLARKHPEAKEEVIRTMQSWERIGVTMRKQATEELDRLVEEQMEYEPEIDASQAGGDGGEASYDDSWTTS